MRQATLCLLVRESQEGKELLLAMKKRGFGIGKWNGVGGKFDPEKGDKNIVDAAIRETEEEIGVRVKELKKSAILDFFFPYQEEWNQSVHVFLVDDWEGEPRESEEMRPKWFKLKDVPFEEMWEDDKFWLPHILGGRKIKAKFIFEEGEKISGKMIKLVKSL
jgi:8-oxo-dGTP pyrophosphatase MutT (NUDIX family)